MQFLDAKKICKMTDEKKEKQLQQLRDETVHLRPTTHYCSNTDFSVSLQLA